MLQSALRRCFCSITYYPFLISPTYELAEYSPAFIQEIKHLKMDKPNFHQVNPERLPSFLASQIKADREQFMKGKEVLFLGRSNVGKSSLINQIFDGHKVARTSKNPGTTH